MSKSHVISIKTQAWIIGYGRGCALGYKQLRDCRIFALGYQEGYVDGLKAAAAKKATVFDEKGRRTFKRPKEDRGGGRRKITRPK